MSTPVSSEKRATSNMMWPFWLAVAVSLVCVLGGWVLGVPLSDFFKENGPIETAGLLAFVIGAVAMVALAPREAFGRLWHITALFLLLAARELDFDKRFMEKGVLQLRLYTGDYPITQKLIGAFFVILILVVVYRLVRLGVPALRAAWREGRFGWVLALAGCVAMVVIAKTIDGAGRKLAPFGIELSPEVDFALVQSEELLETFFALGLVLAVCLWAKARARASD